MGDHPELSATFEATNAQTPSSPSEEDSRPHPATMEATAKIAHDALGKRSTSSRRWRR
jgi:hypothetical protein